MGIIQQQVSKIKGVTDIVFCIDKSRSMSSCIEGVKNNVTAFVNSINSYNPNASIDWRIGFCAYDNASFDVLDFTKDTSQFSSALSSVAVGGDEFTAGAIDYCISGFKWRDVSNRFLLLFTDEILEGGDNKEESKSKFPELLRKIVDNHIYLNFYGPRCPYYSQFSQLSKANAEFLEDENFSGIDFKGIMERLGKTVSMAATNQSQGEKQANEFLFDLSSIKINTL
jgi:hypothetical protein